MSVVLNLADWIERRQDDIGPYAEHIIHSVRAYESEIEMLRGLVQLGSIVCEECGAPAERMIDDWAYCSVCEPSTDVG